MEEYKDVFEGLGCLPGEHRIALMNSVAPVVHAAEKFHLHCEEKLKEELDRM